MSAPTDFQRSIKHTLGQLAAALEQEQRMMNALATAQAQNIHTQNELAATLAAHKEARSAAALEEAARAAQARQDEAHAAAAAREEAAFLAAAAREEAAAREAAARSQHASTPELRVEGLRMPEYHGHLDESVSLYVHRARCLAVMVANLYGLAASWYLSCVSTGTQPTTMVAFEAQLREQFEPPDLQERLRDQLYDLRQEDCTDLMSAQISDMTALDMTMHFMRGLRMRTREAVQYKRPLTATAAIQAALAFERAFSVSLGNERRQPVALVPAPSRPSAAAPVQPERDPYDMEVDYTQARQQAWRASQGPETRQCYNCDRRGHIARDCRDPPRRRNQGSRPPRRRQGQRREAQTNVVVREQVPDDNSSDDDEEISTYGTFTAVTLGPRAMVHKLLIEQGVFDDKPARILLDSGATDNLVRPALVTHVSGHRRVKMEAFDCPARAPTEVGVCTSKVNLANAPGVEFECEFSTWDLNPVINWRTHKIESISPLRGPGSPSVPQTNVASVLTDGSSHGVTVNSSPATPSVVTSDVAPQLRALLETYQDVFPTELPDALPPSRCGLRMAKVEQDACDKFIDKLRMKVPKSDGDGASVSRDQWLKGHHPTAKIRWVLDYRHVNSQTEVPKIPLPNIEDLFDCMKGSTIFSKLDLASGYHQMLVDPASRKYTAFRTHRETYEWAVAPMGLAGMPGVWSRLMRALFDGIDHVVVYMDDICAFSVDMTSHVVHLRAVLDVLRREKLYARPTKCDFGVPQVSFLGHKISALGVHVDNAKVRAIEAWAEPKSPKDLQRFLGLCGYYRKFIARFAELVLPLSALAKSDATWTWSNAASEAFKRIKVALQQAPALQLPDYEQPFVVTTDASGSCCGAVLSQKNAAGHDLPVAYLSKKFGPHDLGWPAHEKELHAIKIALTKWRHFLYGCPFEVFTDNSTCQWFLRTPVLSAKLTRWLDFFSRFDFVLHHRRGVENVVADALSRPPASQPQVHECTAACAKSYDVHVALQEVSSLTLLGGDVLDGLLGTPAAPSLPPQSVIVPHRVIFNHAAQVAFSTVAMHTEDKKRLMAAYAHDVSFSDAHRFHEHQGLYFVRTTNQVWR
ncbi:hypothetical protein ACHHYP_13511 [Achlya hypogyna]|uniref:CCHC-type domain-containing protein n=1 Tax=Achlya hypogyna TaxID=1202772 RepID=A0A1V9YF30_ACHHY|nr:hypothetical protein ACHHYP_13511 [Achlya hypogyna]